MRLNRRRRGIAVTLALIMALVANSFGFLMPVNSVQAAPPQRLYLKWVKDVGVCTYVGPLAADLIPEPLGSPRVLEIVVTGVSRVDSGFTNGTVTVMNGTNGNVLWTAHPGDITEHSPVEIGDLNKDGLPEIVVANIRSTSALYGNGSLYWRNTAAPSYDLYSAIADVNQDGYPEVFVSSGYAPYEGIDYITELSHDGQILRQSNTSWHPCWGGVALGNPNFDGNYILLQGDRSSRYDPGDRYEGGGWGVRALDARTLTPLWNDSSLTCSSHIPMFADVDGDGILDVVVAWQAGGLAVYNAFNGGVLTSGGKYRKDRDLGLLSHSQPTIYDIDSDGHPEIITCHNSNPKIFDLYTWSLDAILNIVTGEPPKMGRVTADPTQMNIIAVEGNNIHVYNQQYQEVDNATYLDNPNQFTLVQDVDGDGYNELLLSSRSGKVYCYGTPALVSNPPPRSNVAFYSEYRRGVAEFVEPPRPPSRLIAALSPADGAKGILPTLSRLSFKLIDAQGEPMNYTVTTSPNIGTGEGTNVYNGVYNVSVSGLQSSTAYSWQVTATDGLYSNTATFTFTTAGSAYTAPAISAPSPDDRSNGVPVTLSKLFFTLTDADNHPMNYTVIMSPNVGSGNGFNVTNGIYNVSVSLQEAKTYLWQVNVTDGKYSTVATFTFTTHFLRSSDTPPQVTSPGPLSGAEDVPPTQSYLLFNLYDAANDLMNYTVTTSPNIGTGNGVNVANGIWNISISGLQYSTTYYWQVYATDGKDNTVVTFTFMTGDNYAVQWHVTFDQTGIDPDFTGTIAVIDGTSYTRTLLPASFWWVHGSKHTFSFSSPLVVNASRQRTWVSTTGLSTLQKGTITITAPGNVVANYAAENSYQITFNQTGLSPDFTGTVLTVDRSNYEVTDLPVSFSWSNGSSHTFSYLSPLVVTANTKQYVWASTNGLSSAQTGTVTITGSGSATGNYKTQYYLTVNSDYALHSGQGWYDEGSTAYASLDTGTVDHGNGTRRLFASWSDDASGTSSTQSDPVIMDRPKTASANWKTQYYLAVKTDPVDIVSIPGENWYDNSAGAQLTAPSVQGYSFAYWDIDGASQGNGLSLVTVTVEASHLATAHYTLNSTMPPQAAFTYYPADVYVNASITFDASASTSGSNVSIVKYEWNFGDGNTTSGYYPTITHTYTTNGSYIVELTITDAGGPIGYANKTVNVRTSSLDGDINDDGTIDIYDAILLSGAYDSVPTNPNWNPRADLNHDGTVDIFDAIILANKLR